MANWLLVLVNGMSTACQQSVLSTRSNVVLVNRC